MEGARVSAALDAAGSGRAQALMLAYCGAAWAADAAETMVLGFLGPAAACAFQVGPAAQSLLSSIVFAGMLGGVAALGALADARGRRAGWAASAALLGAAGLASAAAPSFGALLAARFLVGAALGGTPVILTLFAETLPRAGRGRWLLALQLCWTAGTVGEALLAWALLPLFGWRALLAASAAPLLALLAAFPWLPESPHWLAARGRRVEAEAVLARIAALNGAPPRAEAESDGGAGGSGSGASLKASPSRRSFETERADDTVSAPAAGLPRGARGLAAALRGPRAGLRRVFAPDLRRTTALLWAIWGVNALAYYGLVLLTTALLVDARPPAERCLPPERGGGAAWAASDFLAVVATSLAEAPGLLAAAAAVDARGRRWTLAAGLGGCAAAAGLLALSTGRAARLALLFLARAAIEGSFSVLYVYTPEVYPTEVRAFGLALCNAFSRLGGAAAPFATTFLVASGRPAAAALLLAALCAGAAAAAAALPVETGGRELPSGGGDADEEEDEGAPLVNS
jgi:MFS family permease